MTFHQYDPYEVLESTRLLTNKLVEVNNNTQLQLNHMNRMLEQQARQIAKLQAHIHHLEQRIISMK